MLSLPEFIAAVIDWMPQYQFEPHEVELAFGIEEKPLPAWEVDLDPQHRLSFRGKIDRVDLFAARMGRARGASFWIINRARAVWIRC